MVLAGAPTANKRVSVAARLPDCLHRSSSEVAESVCVHIIRIDLCWCNHPKAIVLDLSDRLSLSLSGRGNSFVPTAVRLFSRA